MMISQILLQFLLTLVSQNTMDNEETLFALVQRVSSYIGDNPWSRWIGFY